MRRFKIIFAIITLFVVANLFFIITNLYASSPLGQPGITSPSNGAALVKGDVTVKWTSVSGASYYKFSLRDLTTDKKLIDNETVNGTSYKITASKLQEGHEYQLSVGAFANDGRTSWSSNPRFSILEKPQVSLTSPTNGATYKVGDTIPVKATAGSVKYVQIYYKNVNNAQDWGQIGSTFIDQNNCTTSWSTAGKAPGQYRIKVQGVNVPNETPLTEDEVIITLAAESKVNLTSPTNGAIYKVGDTIPMKATAGSVKYVQIYYKNVNNAQDWGQIGPTFIDQNNCTTNWSTAGKAPGQYRIKVQGVNVPNETPLTEDEVIITLEDSEPAVINTYPANGASNVPVDSTLTVSFNNRLSYVNIDSSNNIKVADENGSSIAFDKGLGDGTILTIAPRGNLAGNTRYTVTIPANFLKDAAGNILPQHTFSFTTKAGSGSSYYNREDAIAYAKKWYGKENNDDNIFYVGADCAHFVSRCLNAGGLEQFATRENAKATNLYNNVKDDLKGYIVINDEKVLESGDLMFFGNANPKSTVKTHAEIVTSVKDGVIKTASHTEPHYDTKVSISKDGGGIYNQYNDKEGKVVKRYLYPIHFTFEKDSGNTSDNLNSITKKIISENEGGYGGVNPKDGKGASASLSVGKFQWHSERAHDLLNRIKVKIESSNPEQVKIILQGTTLYSELGRDRSIFKARILNSTETKAVSKLLTTTEGKAVQDQAMLEDVSIYLQNGRKHAITNNKTLAYYADLYNQRPASAVSIVKSAGGGSGLTLDMIHQAALRDPYIGAGAGFSNRRNTTYNKCMNLIILQSQTALADTKNKFISINSTGGGAAVADPVGLRLSPESITMNKEGLGYLELIVVYGDGTEESLYEGVLWESDNSSIVSVDEGFLEAKDPGTATITATYGNLSVSAIVYVEGKELADPVGLRLSPENITMNKGDLGCLELIAKYADGTEGSPGKNVLWESDNPSIVSVDEGFLEAKDSGTATITATYGNLSASAAVYVEGKELADPVGLRLSPENITMNKGDLGYLELIAEYADGTEGSPGKNVLWESDNPSIVSVDEGFLQARNPGTVTITATYGNLTASTAVYVKDADAQWQDWAPKNDVDINKEWTITFNKIVNFDTITSQNISVADSSDNPVNVTIKMSSNDGRSVIICPPEGGYHPGQAYTLYIRNGIESATGVLLDKSYKMHFSIV